jgi:hypothetical protein
VWPFDAQAGETMDDGAVRLPDLISEQGDLGRLWQESQFGASRGVRPPSLSVTRYDRVWETVTGLFRGAVSEVASLDDPARVLAFNSGLPQRVMARCGDFQREALERGVDIVQITSQEGFAQNPAIGCIQWGSGGKARLVEQVPYKLLLFDRRLAILPLDGWILSNGILLIRDTAVVSALAGVHRSLWQSGNRIDDGFEGPPAHLSAVLKTLLTEPSDEAARQRLGLTGRTYSRRVAELLALLGVASRFQAGAAAARRGWL